MDENNKHKYYKGILFHYFLIYWYADSIYKKNLPRNAHYSKTIFQFLFLKFGFSYYMYYYENRSPNTWCQNSRNGTLILDGSMIRVLIIDPTVLIFWVVWSASIRRWITWGTNDEHIEKLESERKYWLPLVVFEIYHAQGSGSRTRENETVFNISRLQRF